MKNAKNTVIHIPKLKVGQNFFVQQPLLFKKFTDQQ